jgi:hypothetical protein
LFFPLFTATPVNALSGSIKAHIDFGPFKLGAYLPLTDIGYPGRPLDETLEKQCAL